MKKKSLLDGEFAKQVEASDLIQNKGFSQKEAAEKVGVSERTMCEWMIKYNWIKPDPLEEKKVLAKRLLAQRIEQKVVGRMIGISEKTIGKWANKYGWETKKKPVVSPTIEQVKFAVNNFLLFVDCNAPELSNKIRQLSEKFYKEEPGLLALLK